MPKNPKSVCELLFMLGRGLPVIVKVSFYSCRQTDIFRSRVDLTCNSNYAPWTAIQKNTIYGNAINFLFLSMAEYTSAGIILWEAMIFMFFLKLFCETTENF